MIDRQREHLFLVKKATERIDGRPHLSTVMRWALKGIRGVRLETIKVGGRRFTSEEAIDRFIKHLSDPSPEGPEPESLMDQKRKAYAAARAKAIF